MGTGGVETGRHERERLVQRRSRRPGLSPCASPRHPASTLNREYKQVHEHGGRQPERAGRFETRVHHAVDHENVGREVVRRGDDVVPRRWGRAAPASTSFHPGVLERKVRQASGGTDG